jgi:DNA-binding MarR family transcriptional regulator
VEQMSAQPMGPVARVLRHYPGGAISLVHLNVLAILQGGGGQSMRRLAEVLGVSGASATGIVDRMEERGLVTRQRIDDDRRVVHVEITEAGRELMRGLTADRRQALGQMLEQLDDEELAALLLGARAFRRAHERHLAAMAPEEATAMGRTSGSASRTTR